MLAKVESGTSTTVEIYDLSGRMVRTVQRTDAYVWDGRDESGMLLPPGAYVCQIKLAADVGNELVNRIINLAY